MTWIIGLGNPGAEYAQTRHNVGYMVVDAFAQRLSLPFQTMTKQRAEVARNEAVCLIKPLTFMNNSGVAIRAVMQFFDKQLLDSQDGQTLDSVYIVHDDLDIELGQWKSQLGHGPKAHNGLISIYEQLGTEQFWHVRFGIDGSHRQTDQGRIPGKAYVLQRFATDERAVLDTTISDILNTLETKC
ncbi:MAG: aminoacyl-tRNA hydrolase [Patescibacteria group bacterium]